MSTLRRIEIPIGIFILVSVTVLISRLTGIGKPLADVFTSAVIIVTSFTLVIGVINLGKIHARKVARRDPGWYYGIILFSSAIIFAALNYVDYEKFIWMQMKLLMPLQQAMLSYVGFYYYVALLRGARVRSIDSAILIIVAVLWGIRNMPSGRVFVPIIEPITDFILRTIHAPVQRAFIIGLGTGLLALLARSWLGYERAYLGRGGRED